MLVTGSVACSFDEPPGPPESAPLPERACEYVPRSTPGRGPPRLLINDFENGPLEGGVPGCRPGGAEPALVCGSITHAPPLRCTHPGANSFGFNLGPFCDDPALGGKICLDYVADPSEGRGQVLRIAYDVRSAARQWAGFQEPLSAPFNPEVERGPASGWLNLGALNYTSFTFWVRADGPADAELGLKGLGDFQTDPRILLSNLVTLGPTWTKVTVPIVQLIQGGKDDLGNRFCPTPYAIKEFVIAMAHDRGQTCGVLYIDDLALE